MYTRSQNNKRAVETFLYHSSASESLNESFEGTTLVSNGGLSSGLQEGVVGLISPYNPNVSSTNMILSDSDLQGVNIQFVQGTADSQNLTQAWQNGTYPLTPEAFIASTVISPRDEVIATYQAYSAPSSTVWVVGDTGALASGGIVATENTEYGLTIAYRGYITDQMFSPEGTAFFTPSYTTPNYTALGTVSPLDHMIQNLMWDLNRNSVIVAGNGQGNEPVVGLALDLSGSTGTLVSALVAGFLPVVNTANGVRGITMDTNLVTTLIAALPAGSSIVTIDLTTAGAVANVDAFAVVALDRKLSYIDEIPQVKIDIDLGLRYGFDFNTVQKAQTSFPYEGQGTKRQMELWYKGTHGQRKYNLDHEMFPIIAYPSPFALDAANTTYNMCIIESRRSAQVDTFNVVNSPMKTILVSTKASESSIISLLSNYLTPWLTANNKPLIQGL